MAVYSCGIGSGCWIFSIWLEKGIIRGCDGTLSLTFTCLSPTAKSTYRINQSYIEKKRSEKNERINKRTYQDHHLYTKKWKHNNRLLSVVYIINMFS
uniref:Uncharacterized protein n=1 Tax=Panstrongylus lignarius TaxID=156445 RepID=A0A224XY81_9HEMI